MTLRNLALHGNWGPASRRGFVAGAFGLLLGGSARHALAADTELPRANQLPAQLAAALKQGQPLTVMVSLDGCPYCHAARSSYLLPLMRQGQPLVQVNMRSQEALQDFDGKATSHDALIRRWEAKVAPTLLFVGPGGREIATRMTGSYLPDFYGEILNDRLDAARKALKG